MSDVIDLRPRLRARKQKVCSHDTAIVSDDEATLECEDCGAALDPWWYLRRLAHDDANRRDATDKWIAQRHAEYDAWWAKAKTDADRLAGEVNHLIATKDRLSNEMVGGVHVGMAAARSRRRRRA